jgi:outer membrane receptor protein involved in Fe transport
MKPTLTRYVVTLTTAVTIHAGHTWGQQTPASATPPTTTGTTQEEVIELSPFEVSESPRGSYSAATTLAGNRLNTELRDIGNAVTVVTAQFLADIGATSSESLLQYTIGTEVGNIYGNFAGLGDGAQLNETDRFRNPNQNTRVRGLAEADNSRDYFLTNIPWDSYNVDRVDLQRGPNSIMFGQGSPAGLVNTTTQSASFSNTGNLEFRFGSFGSNRLSLNVNRELIDDELAARVAILRDNEKFKQDPAFDDDERIYAAIRFEPKFLKRGSARTIIRANVEDGKVDSNRPRTLPPYDQLTPWFLSGTYAGRRPGDGNGDGQVSPGELAPYTFQHLNRLTVNAHQAQQDNLFRPNHGQNRPSINGGPLTGQLNPSYQPWVGSMGQNFGGAPWAFFNTQGGGGDAVWWSHEPQTRGGINATGGIDGGVGFNFNRAVTVAPASVWAKAAGIEYAEIYKNVSLADPTVFDFYRNLIDGPNKKEWQDWSAWNVAVSQTFFRDKTGVDFTYNRETYRNGQLSLMTDSRQSIRIDMLPVQPDGTQAGTGTPPNNLPYGDGTPNPNVGRAFITDSGQNGNNSLLSDRESKRVTAFITHDFEREGNSGRWGGLLGKHTVTGLWAEDELRTDQRSWQRYAILDPRWRQIQRYPDSLKFNANEFAPSAVIYLGPSMLDRTTASGARLSRATSTVNLGGTYNVRLFDSTWAPPAGVNPGDPWLNQAFLPPEVEYADVPGYIENPNAVDGSGNPLYPDRRETTQSDNPANYVGWVNVPITITDSETSPQNRDLLSTSARLERRLVESKALVWQGKLLNNAIVGTYGWREDVSESWGYSQDTNGRNAPGHLDLSPGVYRLPTVENGVIVNRRTGGNNGSDSYNKLEAVTSRAYSVVAHLNDLPFLSGLLEKAPLNISLLYAHSTNFQPLASRVDAYGEPIAPPQGRTRERGILFESKDGRFSFKINEFETRVTSASSGALSQSWFIGASQAWAGNWANRFEFNWTGDNIDSAVNPANEDYETNTQYNYGTATGETAEQAKARENAAVAAWRAWQASVDPRFYAAWQMNLQQPFTPGAGGIGASAPAGFTITEDTTSTGYEFELTAMPTRNWRVALNVTKSKATRTNIGGAALAEFINGYEAALKTTPAGDLRIWWGGAGNETSLFQWNQNVGFEWTSRKLQEGTKAPELRDWRINAITNYDFTEGRFRGFNVGGGIRYQSSVVLGYEPVGGADNFSIDLNSPYEGPSETAFDFWLGYGRRLADKVDWRIQLNVRNAFQGDDLIPITVQPDGTPATFRIAPTQTWSITNTFRF